MLYVHTTIYKQREREYIWIIVISYVSILRYIIIVVIMSYYDTYYLSTIVIAIFAIIVHIIAYLSHYLRRQPVSPFHHICCCLICLLLPRHGYYACHAHVPTPWLVMAARLLIALLPPLLPYAVMPLSPRRLMLPPMMPLLPYAIAAITYMPLYVVHIATYMLFQPSRWHVATSCRHMLPYACYLW